MSPHLITTTHHSFSSTATSHLNNNYDVVIGTAQHVPLILRSPKPIFILKSPPQPKNRAGVPPIPARSRDRAKSAVEKKESDALPLRSPNRGRLGKVRERWLTLCSESDEDEEGKEFEREQNAQEAAEAQMRFLYSEYVAGRLVASPISLLDSQGNGYNADSEDVMSYEKAKDIFDLGADGQEFRNPFTEERNGGSDAAIEFLEDSIWLEDMLGSVESPIAGQGASKEAIERAVSDESVRRDSPAVSPKNSLAQTPSEEGVHNIHFSVSEVGCVQEDPEEEIHGQVGEQWPVLFREWAAWPKDRRMSLSDYSSPSKPGSPILRHGEALLYSPIGNPWHAGEVIEEVVAEREFVLAAIDFFAGLEVETLVTDSQISGYVIEDSVELKGTPDFHRLDPHKPKKNCGCYWCERHHCPSLDDFAKHDPNEWCHCRNCENFCNEKKRKKKEADEKQARIEQDEMWRAWMAKLNAEVRDAKLGDERREVGLMYLHEEVEGDSFKPKARRGLGEWVRKILRRANE